MKEIFTYFFSKWWRPFIVVVNGFFVFVIGGLLDSQFYGKVCSYVFGFTLLLFFVSFIYQLVKKKRAAAILTGISFIVIITGAFIYGILLAFLGMFAPDRYADGLTIPTGITIYEPQGTRLQETVLPDTFLNSQTVMQNFELYHGMQPGIYKYQVWLNKIEKGTVFLKAFEITQNDPLSPGSLQKRSSIEVYNPSDTMKYFYLQDDFSIYEGDWDKPYAARFQVWFRPADGGEERKLLEKNYKIEGWMH